MSEARVLLTPLESALDDGIGDAADEPPLPAVGEALDPLEALEAAVLPALQRPPCLAMFSGGRDSSLVLAVASRVARREGLAEPIPTTQVFPDFPETDEARWQKLVLILFQLPGGFSQVFGREVN